MLLAKRGKQPFWRTLVVLGRVANLPTVWSNCLAGWLLGGGGPVLPWLGVCLGVTGLYLGGAFLNDAFDAAHDQQHQPGRPIPAGLIAVDEVWFWGFGALSLGWALLIVMGTAAGGVGLVLVGLILVYDATHRSSGAAPLLMGTCRLLVYLLGASVSREGVTGLVVWSGLVLLLYVTGLSCLARRQRSKGPVEAWPTWLLTAPLLLALVANGGVYLVRALILSALTSAWVLRSLYFTFGAPVRNVGLTVSGLLSGVVLIDALAVAGGEPFGWSLVFAGLFVAAFVAQRFLPST